MKIKDVTRREVASMDDEDLAKAHSQVHGADSQFDTESKKRRREVWEAHNILSAEMVSRGVKHKSPLGKDEDGQDPADSNQDKDSDVVPAQGEAQDADAQPANNIEGPGGVSSDKEPVEKPMKNYHSARIKKPGQYKRIRYAKNEFGDGVDAVYGIKDKDGKEVAEVQAIRFKKTKFTAKQAKAWLKKKGYKYISFEAAAKKEARETRVTIGKMWFLLENMRDALREAFYGKAYYEEFDLDGPTVIINLWDGDDLRWYRIPFEITEGGSIELDINNKEEVDKVTYWVTKTAYTKIVINKKWFLLQNMRIALEETFKDADAWLEDIDTEGPNAIVCVSSRTERGRWETHRYVIPFTIESGGGVSFDMGNKKEVEERVDYTAKADFNLFAPVIKETMDDEKRYALYIVYVPEKDDSQEERMTVEDVEKACWSFGRSCYVNQGERVDVQHQEDVEKHTDCYVVENFVSREEGWMGQPEGTWFAGMIHGPEEWEMLKNGEINGVSIAGKARCEEREVEE